MSLWFFNHMSENKSLLLQIYFKAQESKSKLLLALSFLFLVIKALPIGCGLGSELSWLWLAN